MLVAATVLWLGEFVWFRSPEPQAEVRKPASFAVVSGAIIGSIALSIALRAAAMGPIPDRWLSLSTTTGAVCAVLGAVLRYWAIHELGPAFSRTVTVRADQALASKGPYRMLRHPLYLGLLLLTTGISLFIGSLLGLLLTLVALPLALHLRIVEEERLMEEVIGDRYRTWKQDRYRLIPYLY